MNEILDYGWKQRKIIILLERIRLDALEYKCWRCVDVAIIGIAQSIMTYIK